MVGLDASFTKTGLTLLEAEQRIEALEAAAAKALLLTIETLRRQEDVDKHRQTLLDCVDLLFTELTIEGVTHSQFVESSLERTAKALADLRISLKNRSSF